MVTRPPRGACRSLFIQPHFFNAVGSDPHHCDYRPCSGVTGRVRSRNLSTIRPDTNGADGHFPVEVPLFHLSAITHIRPNLS